MRSSGILLPIFSLPSPYGIGTLGNEAYRFVDFLEQAGQSYWQILPLNPTSFGDSPYQSFSTFAGNPYFIDLDVLLHAGLLSCDDVLPLQDEEPSATVAYAKQYQLRSSVLKKALPRFLTNLPADYELFCKQNQWLDAYADFMTLKELHHGAPWTMWENPYRRRDDRAINEMRSQHCEDISYWKMLQYLFFQQWWRLKDYANQKGIAILGDLPIYVALDSADVWWDPSLFDLNDNLVPNEVAGCPPDGFTQEGQLWGNPLYRYDKMKEDGYQWWIRRIDHATRLYDTTRIDHFRGFDSYYAVPFGEPNAKHGQWRQGPGISFFEQVEKVLGKRNIVAEDLGYLTDSVKDLLHQTGYPGMKVMLFGFDSRENSDYLPHNYPQNCVVYLGTHDNQTVNGWFESAPESDKQFAIEYLRLNPEEGYAMGMIKCAMACVANLCIFQMQDLLGLDDRARINTPSTIGNNWTWRMEPQCLSMSLAKKINHITRLYRRGRTDGVHQPS